MSNLAYEIIGDVHGHARELRAQRRHKREPHPAVPPLKAKPPAPRPPLTHAPDALSTRGSAIQNIAPKVSAKSGAGPGLFQVRVMLLKLLVTPERFRPVGLLHIMMQYAARFKTLIHGRMQCCFRIRNRAGTGGPGDSQPLGEERKALPPLIVLNSIA